MKGLIRFLKVDITIQTILLICILPCVILFFFIGFPLVVLGAWQILSALVVWFIIRSEMHKKYLIGSIGYVLIGSFLIFRSDHFSNEVGMFLFIAGLIVVPIGIALWYYNLTKKTLKALTKNRVIEYNHGEFDHVLDSEEILDNNQNVKLWQI